MTTGADDAMLRPDGPPVRTWRPMILWTAGILLVLGLTWFFGTVVVPVWRLRTEIAELGVESKLPLGYNLLPAFASKKPYALYERQEPDARASWLVARLGGPQRASRIIRWYLAMPQAAMPHRATAVYLLGFCGAHAVDDLINHLDHHEPRMRTCAVEALAMIGHDARKAAPKLKSLQQDQDQEVREAALQACLWVENDSPVPDRYGLLAAYGIDRSEVVPVEVDLSKSVGTRTHGYLLGELQVHPSNSGSSNYYIHEPGQTDYGCPALLDEELLRKVKKGGIHKFYGVLVGSGHKGFITSLFVYEIRNP